MKRESNGVGQREELTVHGPFLTGLNDYVLLSLIIVGGFMIAQPIGLGNTFGNEF